jgi:cytochrome d ubiquinol oxidase subunit II
MIEQALADGTWLPYTFALLMGLSMLIYAVLDGYDLGVGILSARAKEDDKDRMIASIGPFWDANETWLVLGVGLLLVAFPVAHGLILTHLYLPVAIMLIGLIFRGVAFDFRAKVPPALKGRWNKAFVAGSLMTSLSQGYMLGSYILGFKPGIGTLIFSILIALALTSAYCLIGACWLILKCEGPLQKRAVRWARFCLFGTLTGLIAISTATPLISERIFNKWFSYPEFFLLSPLPFFAGLILMTLSILLIKMPFQNDRYNWAPLSLTVGLFILSFIGLAYSFFPYILPDQITIIEAAAAAESLMIMLIGVIIIFPVLIGYSLLSYYIFRGKARDLRYD